MNAGASSVQTLRMGALGMRVIPQHSNEAAALSGQQKIANIWAQAASQFPTKMHTAHGGSVFASG